MYIYGKNVAIEAIKKNKKIQKVYLYKDFNDKNLISAIQNLKIGIKYCTKFELDKLVKGNHQGIILSVPDYQYCKLEELLYKDNPLLVILDHLEDPHNLGAILRTCEAAGIKDIIIPKDRSVSINSTVMKTSAGCLDRVRISEVTNLVNTINYLKNKGYWIIGTDMNGTDYKTLDYKGKIVIVIGNEGKGITRLVKESCDFIASIPMYGSVNSLNASVAAAIILFETRR